MYKSVSSDARVDSHADVPDLTGRHASYDGNDHCPAVKSICIVGVLGDTVISVRVPLNFAANHPHVVVGAAAQTNDFSQHSAD